MATSFRHRPIDPPPRFASAEAPALYRLAASASLSRQRKSAAHRARFFFSARKVKWATEGSRCTIGRCSALGFCALFTLAKKSPRIARAFSPAPEKSSGQLKGVAARAAPAARLGLWSHYTPVRVLHLTTSSPWRLGGGGRRRRGGQRPCRRGLGSRRSDIRIGLQNAHSGKSGPYFFGSRASSAARRQKGRRCCAASPRHPGRRNADRARSSRPRMKHALRARMKLPLIAWGCGRRRRQFP